MAKNQNNHILQKSILKQLYFEKADSCAGLSGRFRKSIPSVSKVLAELIENGEVIEVGYASSNGGRRPMMYSLPDHTQFIVAVAMDQLVTRVNMMDLQNNYIGKTATYEIDLWHNKNALKELVAVVKAFIKKSGVNPNKIIGVGVGMPGFVNVKEGANDSFFNINGKNLRHHLEKEIGLPLWIDNDSSLVALAELRFGMGKSSENVMVINVGWGIGLGMIINGEIFRGYSGYAGEFSHIPTSENDILCECGKRGCLETEASLLAVSQKVMEAIKGGTEPGIKPYLKLKDQENIKSICDKVMEMAAKGDQFAIEILSKAAFELGKGIAILIHIMNPEVVILSGRGAKVGKILTAPIQHALNRYCIPKLAEHMELKISKLGYDAELVGAAALVMENIGTQS